MNFWLVKSEPGEYSWDDFSEEGTTAWTGIRNYAARLHLKAMKKGDKVLFYHSGDDKAIQGIATVIHESYPDPTDNEAKWFAVDLKAGKKLKNPLTLSEIKKEKKLAGIPLLTISRLSVMPLKKDEFDLLVQMASAR